MRVTVLYFAAARELAGCRCAREADAPAACAGPRSPAPPAADARAAPARSEESAETPEGCTAGQLLEQLCVRHAGLAALSPALQLALNQRYAPRDAPLAEGDELALIPPISGG